MYKLPIGTRDFSTIRTGNYIYVDKTKKLVSLIENGRKYFLSKPVGFGKSLMISTLTKLFSRKIELFNGLYAEKWLTRNLKNSHPYLI